MIVDRILDRKRWNEYDEREFYHDVMSYGKTGWEIARAMDGGTNEDVQRALCKYIINNEYNLEICNYINSQVWVEI